MVQERKGSLYSTHDFSIKFAIVSKLKSLGKERW
jgi:hypothetical protein